MHELDATKSTLDLVCFVEFFDDFRNSIPVSAIELLLFVQDFTKSIVIYHLFWPSQGLFDGYRWRECQSLRFLNTF